MALTKTKSCDPSRPRKKMEDMTLREGHQNEASSRPVWARAQIWFPAKSKHLTQQQTGTSVLHT